MTLKYYYNVVVWLEIKKSTIVTHIMLLVEVLSDDTTCAVSLA